jgi:hypothetical protein
MRTVQLMKKMSDATGVDLRIYFITVWENIIICCQIFCDLLLESAFERIFNVMQLILVKIKSHIK